MQTPFLFGKIPAHGDFVSRGLARRHRTAWDLWCSEGLARAQHALGNAFSDAHRRSDGCCFWFGPGPFGRGWRLGAMAPTQDRVGRPFLLILGVESAHRPWAHVAQEYPDRLKALIRRAMAEHWNADEIVHQVPALPSNSAGPMRPDPHMGGAFWIERGDRMTVPLSASVPPDDLIPIMMT